MRSCVLIPCLAFAFSSLAIGCAADQLTQPEPVTTGIEIPLVQAGVGSSVYRLTASFEIRTPAGDIIEVDGTGNDPSLTLPLDPGIHTITLLDGWTLERSTDNGATFGVVEALLGSINPTAIRVVPNRRVGVGFQFIVRSTTGELNISFGVIDPPRQLSCGLRFTEGTAEFAPYVGRSVDLQIYFNPDIQTLQVQVDGSHDRVYDSFTNAVEFFNDPFGQLAPIGTALSGGELLFTNRIDATGVHSFSGTYFGFQVPSITLTFEQSTFAQFTVDENGFPADEFFFTNGSTVLIDRDGEIVARGRISSMRHFQ